MKPLCYVFGPYNAPTAEGVMANVANAATMARALMLKGYRVYVPHTMTMGWTADDDDDYLRMHMAMIPNCHCAFGLQGWEESRGSVVEARCLKENGLPIFTTTANMPDADKFEFDTTSRVVNKLHERRRVGIAHYGHPLMKHNGRNAKQDLFEELADALQYLDVMLEEDEERARVV